VAYSKAVAGCITAVGGRALCVYRYGESGPGKVRSYMPLVKAMALPITGGPAE